MQTKNRPGSGESVDPDDAPVLTKEMLADAEWFEGNRFIKRGRGRPATGKAKEQVSVRLDQDVLAKLRAAGPGWQTQVNALLRAALELDRSDDTVTEPPGEPTRQRRRSATTD